MAALCLDASLETLRPHCYRGTHRLLGDLCRCFREGSLQTVQVVVTLLASHVLQNCPQFIVPGLRSGLPEGQSSAPVKARTFLRSHSWDVLAFGQHLSPAERSIPDHWRESCYAVSQLLVARPLDTLGHQFHTFLAKMKMCHPLMGLLPPNHEVGRVMVSLHPQNAQQGRLEHKACCSGCYTAPRWWKISRPWRGCLRARSQRANGGNTLLLSIGSPSK